MGFHLLFVFGLLQDKKASKYSKFFSTIDSISSELFGVNLFSRRGLTVSCDFERGLIKALSPLRCSVKCCYFHHTQATWRFLSKIGCSGRFRSDEQFRWNVGSLTVLPLFPEETTKTLYAEFKKKIDNVEAETRAVYRHFKRVRLDTFQP